MKDLATRIKDANSQISVNKFTKEQNNKILDNVINSINNLELSEEAKRMIDIQFPDLLNSNYIGLLKTLSYDELMVFKDNLEKCINSIMNVVEEALSEDKN